MEEDEIEVERQAGMFEDNERLQMTVRLKNVEEGTYQIKIYSVNQEFGNIQNEWEKIGYYNDLNLEEMEYLKSVTQPKIYLRQQKSVKGILEIETVLGAQEIQNIIVTEI